MSVIAKSAFGTFMSTDFNKLLHDRTVKANSGGKGFLSTRTNHVNVAAVPKRLAVELMKLFHGKTRRFRHCHRSSSSLASSICCKATSSSEKHLTTRIADRYWLNKRPRVPRLS